MPLHVEYKLHRLTSVRLLVHGHSAVRSFAALPQASIEQYHPAFSRSNPMRRLGAQEEEEEGEEDMDGGEEAAAASAKPES